MSDNINARITFTPVDELASSWIAFALADGSTDGVLYPSKSEAIRHQSNEFLYCFISFRRILAGANPKDCQLLLDFHRHAYDSGFRIADPDAPDLISPLARGVGSWPT